MIRGQPHIWMNQSFQLKASYESLPPCTRASHIWFKKSHDNESWKSRIQWMNKSYQRIRHFMGLCHPLQEPRFFGSKIPKQWVMKISWQWVMKIPWHWIMEILQDFSKWESHWLKIPWEWVMKIPWQWVMEISQDFSKWESWVSESLAQGGEETHRMPQVAGLFLKFRKRTTN